MHLNICNNIENKNSSILDAQVGFYGQERCLTTMSVYTDVEIAISMATHSVDKHKLLLFGGRLTIIAVICQFITRYH